jgi:hypothetical protein
MAWRIVFDECLTKVLEIFDPVSLNIPKVRILATIRVTRITISKNNMPIQRKESPCSNPSIPQPAYQKKRPDSYSRSKKLPIIGIEPRIFSCRANSSETPEAKRTFLAVNPFYCIMNLAKTMSMSYDERRNAFMQIWRTVGSRNRNMVLTRGRINYFRRWKSFFAFSDLLITLEGHYG